MTTKKDAHIPLLSRRPYKIRPKSAMFSSVHEVFLDGEKLADIHGLTGNTDAIEGLLNGAYTMGVSDTVVAINTAKDEE